MKVKHLAYILLIISDILVVIFDWFSPENPNIILLTIGFISVVMTFVAIVHIIYYSWEDKIF